MARPVGKQALVVGAGIGGLAAARVLADHFARVIIVERDVLPTGAEARTGVPQGKHVHALLAGGWQALGALFPGFERDLIQAGAVSLTAGLDVRMEQPGYDPFPQRDLGFSSYALSRPQLELCVRQRVHALSNVEWRPRCRGQALDTCADGSAITGLICEGVSGAVETIPADLVVDASGRGVLTVALL
jgi:2-polyprenyl-6-methoxyphenol hydroxylase-like FAD-dependent oxidoreductase